MLRTAEFVTPLHPDKICDRIADKILDECLKQDPNTRAAIEVMGGHGIITVTGELTTEAYVDIPSVVRSVDPFEKMGVQVNLVKQSPEIARGVDTGGAGDQGIMVGYACNQNEEMVPHEYYLARHLCKYLFERHNHDGKTQITINQNNEIVCMLASFQNTNKFVLEDEMKVWAVSNKFPLALKFNILANPAGDWAQGGFDADTGVTGRKIVIDAYGPRVPVGGGACSGKDPSKVDRSAAYMARYIAKDLLQHTRGFQSEVVVKLAYAIGYNQPLEVSVYMNGRTKDCGLQYCQSSSKNVRQKYDLSPNGIIEFLKLKQINNYSEIASWGHYGNGYNWE